MTGAGREEKGIEMLAEVREVHPDGALVRLLESPHEAAEAWVDAAEWPFDGEGDWEDLRDAVASDDKVDVVVLATPDSDGHLCASRRQFDLSHIDDAWRQRPQYLTVESLSTSWIRGRIGQIVAHASGAEYEGFFQEQRQLDDRMANHYALARGDVVGSFVTGDTAPDGHLIVTAVDYMKAWAGSTSRAAGPLGAENGEPLPGSGVAQLLPETRNRVRTALVVENEPHARRAICGFLSTNGLQVWADDRNGGGTSRWPGNGQPDGTGPATRYDLAVVDVNLGNDSDASDHHGLARAREIAQDQACVLVLVTAERPKPSKVEQNADIAINGFLQRPATAEQFAHAIDDACRTPRRALPEWQEMQTEAEDVNGGHTTTCLVDPELERTHAIRDALADLAAVVPGTTVHLFEVHQRSCRARSLGHHGNLLDWQQYAGKVGKSRIKDVAVDQKRFFENPEPDSREHLWTLAMGRYGSFAGVPVTGVRSEYGYGLVAVHAKADALLGEQFASAADVCAMQLGRALDRYQLVGQATTQAEFQAEGMALEMLAHEVSGDLMSIDMEAMMMVRGARDGSLTQEGVASGLGSLRGLLGQTVAKAAALRGVRAEKKPVSIGFCLRQAALSARRHASETEPYKEWSKGLTIAMPGRDEFDEYQSVVAPAALVIVFYNIYLNAVQQMHRMRGVRTEQLSRIDHQVERRHDDSGQAYALVRIRDTGPGIHPEDYERVMTPGYSTRPSGTGMGLHVCRHLLASMHGSVRVTRSVLWDGTAFTVRLPLAGVEEKT